MISPLSQTVVFPTLREIFGNDTVVNATPKVVGTVVPCAWAQRINIFVESGTADIASLALVFSAANGAISHTVAIAASAVSVGNTGAFLYDGVMGQTCQLRIVPAAWGGGTLTFWLSVVGP